MNTGIKQAVVAYKVTPDGQPVDVDGKLTSVSGKRQAIAVMAGTPNPNPSAYEIELTFTPGGFIAGTPTTYVDFVECPVSIFTLDTTYIVLHPGNIDDIINVFSSFGWSYVSSVPFVTVTPNAGPGGVTTPATAARTSTLGQGYIDFKDNTTNEVKRVYVVNTDALGWILETGTWNDLRFWDAAGVWNY